ncbi:MAG: hypothetical protein AB7N61_22315 [Acidimicrobiia bacterium]
MSGHTPAGRLLVHPTCPTATNRAYALTETDDEYVLRNFGFFEAHIAKSLDEVTCWADPSVPEEMVPVLITGNLMNFIMWLAGDIGLHASTVVWDDELIVVMGARNMGKSTTASALAGAGAQFFGDDLLRVTIGDPIIGHRGTASARLRSSAWNLGASLPGQLDDRVTVDGRRNLSFDLADRLIAPIGVVVVPRISREATSITLERVVPARGVEMYHRLARINGVNDPTMVMTYLEASAALAERVPLVVATIPFAEGPFPMLGRDLLHALAADGLISSPR